MSDPTQLEITNRVVEMMHEYFNIENFNYDALASEAAASKGAASSKATASAAEDLEVQ